RGDPSLCRRVANLPIVLGKRSFFRTADAPQVLVRAEEDVAVRNGRRSVGVFVEPVAAEQLEPRLRGEYVGVAILVRDIKLAVRQDQAAPAGRPQRLLVPQVLAGF